MTSKTIYIISEGEKYILWGWKCRAGKTFGVGGLLVKYKHTFNKNLSLSVSCLNIFNDIHREIVGGAKMGRQVVMRMSTNF